MCVVCSSGRGGGWRRLVGEGEGENVACLRAGGGRAEVPWVFLELLGCRARIV